MGEAMTPRDEALVKFAEWVKHRVERTTSLVDFGRGTPGGDALSAVLTAVSRPHAPSCTLQACPPESKSRAAS